MSRRKNMLEAFTAPSAPEAGGPPSSHTPTLPFGGGRGGGGGRRGMFVGVGLCLAFALGFALGRGGRPVAEARESDENQSTSGEAPAPRPASQPRSFQERAPAEKGPAPTGAPKKLEESALYDAANKYTLVVEAYSKASPEFAWATHDHLAEEGFDVFPPVASGNLLLVLVGAAPRSADLADVEARVRKLERDGKKEYDDAYRQSIDKLISRNLK